MNPDILHEEHYKLYVLFKDTLIFERELEKHGVPYFKQDEEQALITEGIRYYLRDMDREKIDKILISQEIIATTETIPTSDYRDFQKVINIGLIITGIIILIVALYLLSGL